MVVTPTWQAATSGSRGTAGAVNQFLGTHQAQFLYQASLVSSQQTGTAAYSDSLTQWLSQTITTGVSQTAIGYVQLQLSAVGGSPTLPLIPPLTVALYADSANLPTGSAIASTIVSDSYVYSSPFWVTIPLAATGLAPSTKYHLVTSLVGTTGHYYAWQRSNQTSGAATSATGTSWTAQTYGLMYRIYDQSSTGLLQLIYEDNGARWTQLTYNANNTISQVTEYTAGQTTTGYLQSQRTLTYSNGLVVGVS
jgi:hypothetical protein